MGEAETADMPQLAAFQVAPEPLAGIPLRGMGGEPLQVDTRRGPIGATRFAEATAVNRGPVPEAPQPAGHLAQQRLAQGDDIGSVDGLVLAVKISLARGRDGADGGEVLPRPPLPQTGRVACRGSGARATGQGIEP
jgi:hypothetical protein